MTLNSPPPQFTYFIFQCLNADVLRDGGPPKPNAPKMRMDLERS
jgi:hypothetical protein